MAEERDRGVLPGVSRREDRVVLHVDVDCFYAACERLREPALRGEPVVVGMGYESGESVGAVATASYEAREYGVESAQAISTALDRLPRRAEHPDDPDAGHYRPVDMDYYESVAADVKAVLHDLADAVREVSVDEAYLDVTERTDWSVVEGFARHVKQRVAREVGVTASVGVAPNMSAAKVASDHDKPDGLVVVEPGSVADFLAPLDVADLHGIGPVTARELREAGVETVGDLAARDPSWLVARYGDRGATLHARARGVDERPVEPRGRPKSLSRESAFADATSETPTKREQVRTLARAVADRARRRDARYRTVGLKVVTPPYDVQTRERSLPGPVDEPDLVEEVALEFLEEFEDEAVRKVGVRVSNLDFGGGEQSRLDGWEGDGGAAAAEDGAAAAAEDGAAAAAEDGAAAAAEDGAAAAAEDGAATESGAAADGPGTDGEARADRAGQRSLDEF